MCPRRPGHARRRHRRQRQRAAPPRSRHAPRFRHRRQLRQRPGPARQGRRPGRQKRRGLRLVQNCTPAPSSHARHHHASHAQAAAVAGAAGAGLNPLFHSQPDLARLLDRLHASQTRPSASPSAVRSPTAPVGGFWSASRAARKQCSGNSGRCKPKLPPIGRVRNPSPMGRQPPCGKTLVDFAAPKVATANWQTSGGAAAADCLRSGVGRGAAKSTSVCRRAVCSPSARGSAHVHRGQFRFAASGVATCTASGPPSKRPEPANWGRRRANGGR